MDRLRLSGPHTQTMDERGRIPVPSKLMDEMRRFLKIGKNDPVQVVITMTSNLRLGVFPRDQFFKTIDRLEAAPESDTNAKELLTDYYNFMDEQTLDKQNRFRVPNDHADLCGLSRGEVTLLGSGHYMEVVRRDKFLQQAADRIQRMKEREDAVRNAPWYSGQSATSDAKVTTDSHPGK